MPGCRGIKNWSECSVSVIELGSSRQPSQAPGANIHLNKASRICEGGLWTGLQTGRPTPQAQTHQQLEDRRLKYINHIKGIAESWQAQTVPLPLWKSLDGSGFKMSQDSRGTVESNLSAPPPQQWGLLGPGTQEELLEGRWELFSIAQPKPRRHLTIPQVFC